MLGGADVTTNPGQLTVDGVLDSGLDIPLAAMSPFSGLGDWSVSFSFATQGGDTGALFSSDGSHAIDPGEFPGGQQGSLNVYLSSTGELSIKSDSEDTEFAFAGDTSGVLAALGLNTFFTGSSAIDLGVNSALDDERLFAASSEGIDNDTRNAEVLAVFYDRSLEDSDGNSLAQIYSQLVNGVTQGSSIATSVADGFRIFENSLDGEQQAVSGVNIDEEAIKMIVLQRAFQAAARHVQTVSDLLDILVNL